MRESTRKGASNLEAPAGFEPADEGFADLSLNHLGTAPSKQKCTRALGAVQGHSRLPTMADQHEYPVSVEWNGGRKGAGSVTGRRSNKSLPLSVPPEFNGPGEGSNPEEILSSAVAGCYTMTYAIIAEMMRVEIKSLRTEATGIVEKQGAKNVFTKVILRPKVGLTADADEATVKKAEDIAHKADEHCIISNAVRANVELVVEPEITRES